MEKTKSYIGLIIAISIAVILFFPHRGNVFNPDIRVTKLDTTLVSLAIQTKPEFNLLKKIVLYEMRCPNGPATAYNFKCESHELTANPEELNQIAERVGKYDPEFLVDLNDLARINDSTYWDKYNILSKRAIGVYPEITQELRKSYEITVYIFHIIATTIILLLIIYRKYIGSVIVSPTIFFIKSVVRLAKNIHKKI